MLEIMALISSKESGILDKGTLFQVLIVLGLKKYNIGVVQNGKLVKWWTIRRS